MPITDADANGPNKSSRFVRRRLDFYWRITPKTVFLLKSINIGKVGKHFK